MADLGFPGRKRRQLPWDVTLISAFRNPLSGNLMKKYGLLRGILPLFKDLHCCQTLQVPTYTKLVDVGIH